jgi:hypothetical protein
MPKNQTEETQTETNEQQQDTRPIEVRKAKRRIQVPLTESEVAAKAREAAELRVKVSAAEAELSTIKSEFKERIEELDGELSAHLSCIRRGKEERLVEVEDHFDYAHSTVETYYAGSLVISRTMTTDEKQMQLLPPKEVATDENAAAAAH